MNKRSILYGEAHSIQLNMYLLFYAYIFAILIIANVLPRWSGNYFLFLFAGIAGIGILFIKYTYNICVKENSLEVFIKIPFKIILLKLNTKQIAAIQEIKANDLVYSTFRIPKKYSICFSKKSDGIKVTMFSGKVFIIAGFDNREIIEQINRVKKV